MVLVLTFEGLPVRADQPEISKIRDVASSIDPASGAVSSTFERYDSLSDNIDRGSSDALQSVIHSSEQASSKHGSVFIKGKKREMLIDDVVGSASSRVTSALDNPVLDGVKGKRIERDRDQNGDIVKSNSVSGASRSSMDSFRSERKTKAKPKQKISHLSTSGSSFHGRLTEATEPACPPAQASSHFKDFGANRIKFILFNPYIYIYI
ncbi:hypothetical protein CFP56_009074 [Quercus suber]|uniref:Uncharacterized protein n=1 Tax=Quercus suber TaxID=58331 RepID=A0AAW0L205_QUESU